MSVPTLSNATMSPNLLSKTMLCYCEEIVTFSNDGELTGASYTGCSALRKPPKEILHEEDIGDLSRVILQMINASFTVVKV